MSNPFRALRLSALAAGLLALLSAAALAGTDALTPAQIAALDAPQALPDIVEGKADAPATIVEYASMTCSHCAAFHKDVWPALKAKYVDSGKAKFVLREFPLDRLGARRLHARPLRRARTSATRSSTACSTIRPTGPSSTTRSRSSRPRSRRWACRRPTSTPASRIRRCSIR